MSFDSNSAILPFYTTAYDAYQSLFKNLPVVDDLSVNLGENPDAQLEANIFNFIKNPAQRDMANLSNEEKTKLNRYLSAVEDMQLKSQPVVSFGGSEVLSSIPIAKQSSLDDLTHYLDMIRVGFANNTTTSAVLGIGDIHDIDQFHHHHAHGKTPTYWNTRSEFAQRIVDFANALDKTLDTDGNTLLDNTIIVLTGEVGDGGHDIINKGHIVIGGGGGNIQMGRYLKQDLVSGYSNIKGLKREDIKGKLQQQITFGNGHEQKAGSRTNADLLREVGNMAGLNLSQFGLASQNKGSLLS